MSGLATRTQQAAVPQLIQDEAVNHLRRVADVLRSHSQHIQPQVWFILHLLLRLSFISYNQIRLHHGRFFRETLKMFFEFIPQVIFLLCIFGYLILLIFYKWLQYDEFSSAGAPSLLIRQWHSPPISLNFICRSFLLMRLFCRFDQHVPEQVLH